uniref:MFS transporter n=1 Tax=Paraconexibacter sp. TaxID=2949640 RepID=UPI003564AFB3
MHQQQETGHSRRAILTIAAAGGFLAFLDTTIVNTSFPDIAASFPAAGRSELAWILDAYFIVIAALLVPAGLLADRIGRKRAFLGGVALFAVTSGLCAVAPTWETLVGARVLQGVAAAVIAPVSLALVLPEYPRHERATAVGIWGAAAALAAACGPPLGGLLVEVADWRWIFLVNLPVSAALMVLGVRHLRESRDEHAAGTPDLLGAVVTVLGLGALALAIIEGREWGWTGPQSLASFGAAAVLLAVVARRCLTHPVPIVDPALMAIRSFRLGNAGTLLVATAFFATILGNILFLTQIWGYSVLSAGLAVVPGPVST